MQQLDLSRTCRGASAWHFTEYQNVFYISIDLVNASPQMIDTSFDTHRTLIHFI